MTAARASAEAGVGIRDRRELPFFQVRVHAVQAIRAHTGGPRRLRAIGFYALLCQLANEQRHQGEHRIVRVTYDTLAARGQMSKRSVKQLLDTLERAQVLRYERLSDRATGSVVSLLHLLILDEPWIALTVTMADHLAGSRDGGHLLRDLGQVVVLLEFCAEQRAEHGGLAAEVTRADIAEQTGLAVDRVDDCNRVLESCGLLQIERRRAANGGRNLPSVYTIHEAPTSPDDGGETVLAGRRNGTARAAERYSQGGVSVLAGPQSGTGRADNGYRASGDSATPSTVPPRSNTRVGQAVEETAVENIPSSTTTPKAEGRGQARSSEEQLCEQLLSAWAPALGDSPRHNYESDRSRWLAAAARLLQRHPAERLAGALAYMVTDEILGSQALTMPGFAKVADQLIARAYARQQRTNRPAPASSPAGQAGWEDAKHALERAIQRHGREGRAAATEELAARDPRLVEFVERVRWTTLCEQPLRYSERRYAELWAELGQPGHQSREEHAA